MNKALFTYYLFCFPSIMIDNDELIMMMFLHYHHDVLTLSSLLLIITLSSEIRYNT